MNNRRMRLGWSAVVASLILCAAGRAAETSAPSAEALLPLLEDLPPDIKAKVRKVIDKPAMHARGQSETFRCQPDVYQWLLDHPDRAVKAWHRLGAKCMLIKDRGEGRFGCKDNQGNDVMWSSIVRNANEQVWYAEGVVRPAPLMPLVGVKALFVVHIVEGQDSLGRKAIRHQGEVVLHCDSKAIGLITRILGASAPRMAEQYVGQIQTFFGALAWYLNEHPGKIEKLLAE